MVINYFKHFWGVYTPTTFYIFNIFNISQF